MIYLDLHAHSTDASDDAGATVEGYLKWCIVRKKQGYKIDGFALTEHRSFDHDLSYDAIAEKYGLLVLKGAELETDIGHMLAFGINKEFTDHFDLTNVQLSHTDILDSLESIGGIAIPAHAGRPSIGMAEYIEKDIVSLDKIIAIESSNGGSNHEENAKAESIAQKYNFKTIGGSDSHFVSSIGKCVTAFEDDISNEIDLVNALRNGLYSAYSE
ncbi:MAG: hypothetical protein CL872_05630 [Dehalococcoidaceae bacterium]|nr:hypothetical protein [Dehalococcoidaceae bacterium]